MDKPDICLLQKSVRRERYLKKTSSLRSVHTSQLPDIRGARLLASPVNIRPAEAGLRHLRIVRDRRAVWQTVAAGRHRSAAHTLCELALLQGTLGFRVALNVRCTADWRAAVV